MEIIHLRPARIIKVEGELHVYGMRLDLPKMRISSRVVRDWPDLEEPRVHWAQTETSVRRYRLRGLDEPFPVWCNAGILRRILVDWGVDTDEIERVLIQIRRPALM
jgi:hypothetical protein